jgi:hypothetical protein
MTKITADIKAYVKEIEDMETIIRAIKDSVNARELQTLKKFLKNEINERLTKVNKILIVDRVKEENLNKKGE